MPQLFSYKGKWMTLEQVKMVKEREEKEVEEPKEELSRKEVMEKLREKGIKFKATAKTEDLINLLN